MEDTIKAEMVITSRYVISIEILNFLQYLTKLDTDIAPNKLKTENSADAIIILIK